eukprot:TRINITY_DN9303_c0_g1_i1.p1 TRINITY_DN9303_c0_g1~~TRINITY_DN9303_c0_g1_i1.p1  ORF type:complete len:247 (-),score=28.82 TRINITY_DN9303_c0_g1_i1:165-905(-)
MELNSEPHEKKAKTERLRKSSLSSVNSLDVFPFEILSKIVAILKNTSNAQQQFLKLRRVSKTFCRIATEYVIENLIGRVYDKLTTAQEHRRVDDKQVQEINFELGFVTRSIEHKRECRNILRGLGGTEFSATSKKKLEELCNFDSELWILSQIIAGIDRVGRTSNQEAMNTYIDPFHRTYPRHPFQPRTPLFSGEPDADHERPGMFGDFDRDLNPGGGVFAPTNPYSFPNYGMPRPPGFPPGPRFL